MACGLDPLHGAEVVPGAAPANLYALVGYIPAPLGDFLDGLRAQLVPDCRLRSHVSLLPPRPISGSVVAANKQIHRMADETPPFNIVIDNIEIFEETCVIYLGLEQGTEELLRIHSLLNSDSLGFQEPFCYHPHITLAQKFSVEQLPRLRKIATEAWAEYGGIRGFALDTITFVQNCGLPGLETSGACCKEWIDLDECRLGR